MSQYGLRFCLLIEVINSTFTMRYFKENSWNLPQTLSDHTVMRLALNIVDQISVEVVPTE